MGDAAGRLWVRVTSQELRPDEGRAVIDLAIDAAAGYRLTRLVTTDTFPPIKALRERIVERHTMIKAMTSGDGSTEYLVTPDALAELVQCPHCASFWIASAVVAARAFVPRLWGPLARA